MKEFFRYSFMPVVAVFAIFLISVIAVTGQNPFDQRRWLAKEIDFHNGAKEIIWADRMYSSGDTIKVRIYTYVLIKRL